MKRIIIIGAGMAGLSASIFAVKNGFDTTIYESHYLSGGMCTGWRRKDFYFEGCLHYIKLLGTGKASMFHDLWKELGVIGNITLLDQDYIQVFRDEKGRELRVYVDPDKLRDELLRLSPQDSREIKELCKVIRAGYWFTHKARSNPLLFLLKLVNIAIAMPFLFKYGALSLKEYADRFSDPLVSHALRTMFDYDEISCVQLPLFLGMYRGENVNYPAGGSLALAKAVENRALKSGVKIVYKLPVVEIIKDQGRAVGVKLSDGTIQKADYVLSATDGYSTLFQMFGSDYAPQQLIELYGNQPLYTSFIQVSIGLDMELEQLPSVLRVKSDMQFEIAGEQKNELCIVRYGADSQAAPAGKSVVIVLYKTNFAWWESVEYKSAGYKAIKESILRITLKTLEQYVPGISERVEVSDVSTPHTMIRYTRNHKAALGFIPTATYMQVLRHPWFKLDTLDNFYMAGQWVSGMGIPNAALSGMRAIEEICKSERRKFIGT